MKVRDYSYFASLFDELSGLAPSGTLEPDFDKIKSGVSREIVGFEVGLLVAEKLVSYQQVKILKQ